MKSGIVAEIARAFLEANHELPNRTAAKILRQQNPKIAMTVEQWREKVRRIRGAKGVKERKRTADKSLFKPVGWQINAMPATVSVKRQDVQISGKNRVLVLSDIHIPYHDENALKSAVEFGVKVKPSIILLNGDIGDFYGVSRHSKDPRRELSQELEAIRQFLFWLRKQFPKARILYKVGNHEDRLHRFMLSRAPELLGINHFTLSSFLHFDELKIELVESLQLIRLGFLPVYHGHELPQGMSSPVNPARGIWMRVQESLLCGHWHRTSEHTESTGLEKRLSSCWSTGCLCDLSPDYAIVNRWNHGFAVIEIDDAGQYEVSNYKIINGKIY